MKKSPFRKPKQRSIPVVAPTLANDPASLAMREEQRQHFDIGELGLEMRFETHSAHSPVFARDFQRYVDRFPHHEELVKLLIAGIDLSSIGKSKAAFQTYQNAALAIENFVEFLNSDEPLSKNVFCVADITFGTAKLFHSWLIRTAPARTTNRKLYAEVRRSVLALQKSHSKHERIGLPFSWPPGPRNNGNVSESYPTAIFNQLVDRSLSDLNQVVSKMSQFDDFIGSVSPFTDGDGIRPTWRTDRALTGYALNIEDSERKAFSTARYLHPKWPLGIELGDALKVFSHEVAMTKCKLELAVERTRRVLQSSLFGPTDAPMASGQLAYISHFAFCGNSMYPFFLFVQLNTGWNQESISALTDCLDDHIEQDLIDKHYCIIYSTKQRNNKAVSHRANMKSPLSVYRILRFVEAQVTKHKTSPHYIPGVLWQYVVTKNLWSKVGKMCTAIDSRNLPTLSRSFLDRHKIDLRESLKYVSIEGRKLRTTYQTRRREQGLSTEAMVDLMGHSDIDTTALHYDSDVGSSELKNRHIRSLQDGFLEDFAQYRTRLVQSSTLQELRLALENSTSTTAYEKVAKRLGNATVSEVVHLLSPLGQTYIASCKNAKEPTWEGADKFISVGDTCRFFNRCCMCDKSVIFKEALPWVARRTMDLDALREKLPTHEWTLNYADEFSGWQWVLNSWNNRADIEDAVEKAIDDRFKLPLTMRGN